MHATLQIIIRIPKPAQHIIGREYAYGHIFHTVTAFRLLDDHMKAGGKAYMLLSAHPLHIVSAHVIRIPTSLQGVTT